MRHLVALFAMLVLAFAFVPIADAQWADPVITVDVSANVVEVGEAFSLQLKAMVASGAAVPTDPQLKVPATFTSEGPRVGSQSAMSWVNGVVTNQMGISALWNLTATREGKFTIPSPTVSWMGKRVSGRAIPIEVVAQGKGPRRRPRGGSLLPGGMGGWPFAPSPFDADVQRGDEQPDNVDLSLPSAPAEDVFLRAVIDKTRAVVGEQVTIKFYRYERDVFDPVISHVAPLADFTRVQLKDPDTRVWLATAGTTRFRVILLESDALFPLKSGNLHTGSRVEKLQRRGRAGEVERRTEDLVVRVTEPPKQGRPPGYALGDVGQLALSVMVQPRRIEQDGSIGVTVKVAGSGNFPQDLRVPARQGVEWLDPEKKEKLEPAAGKVSGYRTFGYVVRVHEVGTVDLGKIDLPYWDPDANRYQVATATLGTVDVTPSAKAAPAPSASAGHLVDEPEATADPLAVIGGPRTKLAPFARADETLLDGFGLWFLLAAPPLAFGVFTFGSRANRALADRRAHAKDSLRALALVALAEAEVKAKAGDAKGTAASLERAIHLAIEDATGHKSRGALLEHLADELVAQGVADALAKRVSLVLKRCDALRFAPDADAAMEDLLRDARAIVDDLESVKVAA